MTKKELLEKYNKHYTEEEFYKQNVTYAFSEEQLQKAMKKLGATSENELTSFGFGSICLRSKFIEIIQWMSEKERERKEWLKSLQDKEKDIIIEYELYNYECDYTDDIDDVVDLFKNVFTWNDIMHVFHKITKQ